MRPQTPKGPVRNRNVERVLFLNGGPRNSPLTKTDSSPRYKRENPLCCPSLNNENFLGFHLEDKAQRF